MCLYHLVRIHAMDIASVDLLVGRLRVVCIVEQVFAVIVHIL